MKEINSKSTVGSGRPVIIKALNVTPPNASNTKKASASIKPNKKVIVRKAKGCSGCSRRRSK